MPVNETDDILTRALPTPIIECIDAYVVVGDYVSFKGTHCWVVHGGGGPDIPYKTGKPYTPDGYPTSQGSGGNGGFNNGTSWYFPYTTLQNSKLYNARSTLNLNEKEALIATLDILPNKPKEYKELHDYLISKGIRVHFKLSKAVIYCNRS